MNKLSFILATAALVCSCTSEDVVMPQPDTYIEDIEDCYAISIDEAIDNLYDLLDCLEPESRTGTKKRVIDNTFSVSQYPGNSRSSRGTDSGNIFHVVNFADNEGFAILAADNRIPDKVLAITEQGSISQSEMEEALADNAMSVSRSIDRKYYPGYPTTGDGFFTLSEYPDEIFLNPNTVDLFDPYIDDTLVGDYTHDTDVPDTKEDIFNPGVSYIDPSNPGPRHGSFLGGLCMTYALDGMNGGGGIDDNFRKPDPDKGGAIGGIGDPGPSTYSEHFYSDWEVEKSVKPMLTRYKYVGQHDPFNEFYPYRRSLLIIGKKGKALVGCVPLAIGKIMCHFKKPSSLEINGYKIDWDAIERNPTKRGVAGLSRLFYTISQEAGSLYFYQGTFTFPWKVKPFMKKCGYLDACEHGYDTKKVLDMLDNNRPLMAFAAPRYDVSNSHAWNIDGYNVYTRNDTTKTYERGTGRLMQTSLTTQRKIMLHCHWGWYGDCDGYFTPGIFDMFRDDVIFDGLSEDKKKYDTWLGIITYRTPQ